MNSSEEWLEADGLGGFASGTSCGLRTRRYHALLLSAHSPPTGRLVLVNGFDAWIEAESGSFPLTSQRYEPDAVDPDGMSRIDSFSAEPWPTWTYALENGVRVQHEMFLRKETRAAILTWKLPAKKKDDVTLVVRPYLSGRDYHCLQRENDSFRFDANQQEGRVIWRPYEGVPGVITITNGDYFHEPVWYRNFTYDEEKARGLDHIEDLAAPGVFRFALKQGEATIIFAPEGDFADLQPSRSTATAVAKKLRTGEKLRRGKLKDPLLRAADAYIVQRGDGSSILAGYPWFTDWGRDTFIALRGLCLAAGKLDLARDILVTWAGLVSEGMLPNRFPDHGDAEYNSVDASLWFILAVRDYFEAVKKKKRRVKKSDQTVLESAVDAILEGYTQGTRFGIKLDADGLLQAGAAGVALTWMDACIDGEVITPRSGKPVEIQALWLNALWTRHKTGDNDKLYRKGLASFRARFWNAEAGCLFDVVDVDHQPGVCDASIRPNQIFAAGGLPVCLLEEEQAKRVVLLVEDQLWTLSGLRTLAPTSPGYCPRYEGDRRQRDLAYHQGTAWPWLIGPFVDAWLHAHGRSAKTKKEARGKFLEPLLEYLHEAGLGHLSEIADGDLPHTPRGCPFQAWSVGEALRLDQLL